MIGFYIMMLGVVALSSVIGYTIFASVQSSSNLASIQRNLSEMDVLSASLRDAFRVVGEDMVIVPMGDPSDADDSASVTTLPSWIAGSAFTPWGAIYGYCPYAPVAASDLTDTTVATVNSPDDSYTVRTKFFTRDGTPRKYVLEGSRPTAGDLTPAPEVLAFIVSPLLNATALPDCNDILYDQGTWRTSGNVRGIVRAITRDAVVDALVTSSSASITRHVSTSGAGAGRSSDDPMSFASALNEWASFGTLRTRLQVQAGTYALDLGAIALRAGLVADTPDALGFGRSLHLLGPSGGVARLQGSGADKVLRLPFDALFSNITLASGAGLRIGHGARFVTTGTSELRNVAATGATLMIGNDSSGGDAITILGEGSTPALTLEGGSAILSGVVTIDGSQTGIRLNGAQLVIAAGALVTVTAPTPIETLGGGSILIQSGGDLVQVPLLP
jgi:hypothetical protein